MVKQYRNCANQISSVRHYSLLPFIATHIILNSHIMDWPTSLPFPVLLYSTDRDESPLAKWNKDALISKLGDLKLYVIIKMTMASSTYYRRQQVGLWMEQEHMQWKVNMTMLNRWKNLFRSCFEKETEIWKPCLRRIDDYFPILQMPWSCAGVCCVYDQVVFV